MSDKETGDMLFTKLHSAVNTELENANEDYKTAKRIGQYKFSSAAIYMADGTYIPLKAVTDVVSDKSSVHVTGCCAGCVPVERLILTASDKKIQLLFDSKKEIEKAVSVFGTVGITPTVRSDT